MTKFKTSTQAKIDIIKDHYEEMGEPELLDEFDWSIDNIDAEYNIIMGDN